MVQQADLRFLALPVHWLASSEWFPYSNSRPSTHESTRSRDGLLKLNLPASYFGLAPSLSWYAFLRTSTASFFSIFSENKPFRL